MWQVLQAIQKSGLLIHGKSVPELDYLWACRFRPQACCCFLATWWVLYIAPGVYPLPNMLDFATKAASCTVFSKIDLHQWHRQQPVNPEDVH
jgi:hypothetical protein